ncbi:Uncharacterised protein [Achromobacter xylosoxidans]|nr:Uncharacterised protein [Achromobacter xylosoxidans]
MPQPCAGCWERKTAHECFQGDEPEQRNPIPTGQWERRMIARKLVEISAQHSGHPVLALPFQRLHIGNAGQQHIRGGAVDNHHRQPRLCLTRSPNRSRSFGLLRHTFEIRAHGCEERHDRSPKYSIGSVLQGDQARVQERKLRTRRPVSGLPLLEKRLQLTANLVARVSHGPVSLHNSSLVVLSSLEVLPKRNGYGKHRRPHSAERRHQIPPLSFGRHVNFRGESEPQSQANEGKHCAGNQIKRLHARLHIWPQSYPSG